MVGLIDISRDSKYLFKVVISEILTSCGHFY